MKIGLVAASGREDALDCAARAAAHLRRRGAEPLSEQAEIPGCGAFSDALRPDVLVSLGGDGTILRCVQHAVRFDAPLLGVNLGSLGFLTEEEPGRLEQALDAVLAGEYEREPRTLLDVRVRGGESRLALNDAVITRGGYPRLIRVRAWVDGEVAGQYRADGLIVSTPTGSTGYSLSAGGPIVSPAVDCMVITPVCAHSLQHRPLVVPGGASVSLELYGESAIRASLEVDGQTCAVAGSGSRVDVSRASQRLSLIRLRSPRFFSLVHRKLAEWAT